MRPRQLIQFLAICRHGSMSAAASELNIAQPALSKQMAQLEHELGATLFVRHSRGVTLTRSGQRLSTEAAELIRRFDSLKQSVQEASNDVSGCVTLAVISSLAPAIAVEIYPLIERQYPNISLRIVDHPSDRASAVLLQQEADLAILPNAAADLPNTTSLPLFQEQFYFLSAATPHIELLPITMTEAASQPLVLPFHGHDLRRRIEEAVRNLGVPLHIKYETGSINVIGQLVEEGLAHSIVPATFWLDKISSGRIMMRAITAPSITRVHSICWLPDTQLSPAAETVKGMIVSTVQAMISNGTLSGKIALA